MDHIKRFLKDNDISKLTKLFLVAFFLVWIAVICVCMYQLIKAEKYELGYGQYPTVTITKSDTGVFYIPDSDIINFVGDPETFSIEEVPEGEEFGKYGYGVSNGYFYFHISHNKFIDLVNTKIYRITESGKEELNREELCVFMRSFQNGKPDNVELTMVVWGSGEYPSLKNIEVSGAYEGVLEITEKSPGVPVGYTDCDEVFLKANLQELPHILVFSVICVGIFLGLSVPLVYLARKQAYVSMFIYGCLVIVLVLLLSQQYSDSCHAAIGVNWHSSIE